MDSLLLTILYGIIIKIRKLNEIEKIYEIMHNRLIYILIHNKTSGIIKHHITYLSGISRNKTMDNKLSYNHNDDKQNSPPGDKS